MLHLHLLAQAVVSVTPWDWAANHIHLVGWPAIVLIAWKVRGYFNNVSNQFTKAVGQIDTMASNHFPHMEQSLAKQDVFLESIDKNIARLADKM